MVETKIVDGKEYVLIAKITWDEMSEILEKLGQQIDEYIEQADAP